MLVFEGTYVRTLLHRRRDATRSGREALISCGAALDHLRVPSPRRGGEPESPGSPTRPDLEDTTHLASIDFTPAEDVTDDERRRASAIWVRRTDRLPFIAPMNFEALEPSLRGAIDNDAVYLDVMASDVRDRLARASSVAESLRLYDTAYHEELHWRTTPFEGAEGVPYSALVSPAESERVDVEWTFPMTHNRERRTEIPEDESTILMLSTDDDTPRYCPAKRSRRCCWNARWRTWPRAR